jgi:hypothetical protein
MDDVHLAEDREDSIRWWPEESGEYSVQSAYLLQFSGSIDLDFSTSIWQGWAPGKCKFFLWTAALERILTADALQRRGWVNDYFCPFCVRNLETPMHLLVECPWTRQIWSAVASWSDTHALLPSSWNGLSTVSAWLQFCHQQTPTDKRKGTKSLLMLTVWEIWRERNRRIFQHEMLSAAALVARIRDEAILWNMAGAIIPFDPG